MRKTKSRVLPGSFVSNIHIALFASNMGSAKGYQESGNPPL